MKLYPNLIKLKDYSPEEYGFTTDKEMKMISETLHLDEATTDDLFNYRTLTVALWGGMYENERSNKNIEKATDVMEAMESITAVLDKKLWEMGGEV